MIRKGSKVKWKWGSGTAEGRVRETYSEKVTRTIKGGFVTRNGEPGNKALLSFRQMETKCSNWSLR